MTSDTSMVDAEEMMEGVTLAPSSTASPPPNALTTTASLTILDKSGSRRLPITVTKPTPYTFDLGNLLATDPNPLPSNPDEETLQSTARDGAQALINQLLTTCPITSSSSGVLLQLPSPSTPLPREKPIPATNRPLTKWQQFAAKKGIAPKKKEGKMVYDEASGEWVPKWGYKGANKKSEADWLVEVDETKKEGDRKRIKGGGRKQGGGGGGVGKGEGQGEGEGNPRNDKRRERIERVKRAERKMRANERVQRRGSVR